MARRKRGTAFGCNELVISVNRLLSEIYWSTKILFEVVRCGEEVMVASWRAFCVRFSIRYCGILVENFL